MSDAISRIRAHFDSLATRRIEVPEWNLTVFSSPVTIAERTRIYQGEKNDDYSLMISILIVKAKDEAGVPLFTIGDKADLLRHADSSVLIRVAAEIMATDAPRIEELEKS